MSRVFQGHKSGSKYLSINLSSGAPLAVSLCWCPMCHFSNFVASRYTCFGSVGHLDMLYECKHVSNDFGATGIVTSFATPLAWYRPHFWGNPTGPLFEGASFKTQVDRLPTSTRTCKWPALWRLHLQMGFATTEPWLRPRRWRVTTALGNPFPCKTALGNPFPCRKVCFAQKPL